jgi:hypothetical protein
MLVERAIAAVAGFPADRLSFAIGRANLGRFNKLPVFLSAASTTSTLGLEPVSSIMATQDTTSMVTEDARRAKAALRGRKPSRPMTAGQELLFFGISFTIALLLQLVVLLNFADVIAW